MKKNPLETFMPFLIIGFAIALLVGLFFIIANVLVWGILIAGVLWLGVTLRQLFLTKFGHGLKSKSKSKHKGIIIDHDKK
tara:strand:+ start:943 stop:1182 length:240 start_codon:yes stop_codon:yes gene_type:complete